MELTPRPELFDFHGVSMTKYFTDNWRNVQDFKARPDDILIATYPKAGEVTCGRAQSYRSVFKIIIHSFYIDIFSDWYVLRHNTMCLFDSVSGTTWVSYILDLLYFGHLSLDRQTSIPLQERVPFLEICIPSKPTGLIFIIIRIII